jgi:L-lactate dehydrogenase complex protein LldG
VRGGVSENQYAIAELGTLVQAHDGVDERIAATASEFYVGVVRGSAVVEQYDDMFDLLCGLPELPNFVGFMTGPSRTDIECVTTVGVHGPIQLAAVVVDDE